MKQEHNPASDAISGISNRLLRHLELTSDQDDHASVVVMMSCDKKAGVTSVTKALAEQISGRHRLRVMVIGYDTGKTGVAAQLGGAADEQINACAYAEDMLSSIAPLQQGQLDVLTLDETLPPSLNRVENWLEHLQELRSRYEVIIVDSGSIDSGIPMRWARHSHETVLVIDAKASSKERLIRLRAELQSMGRSIHAVVINKRPKYIPEFIYKRLRSA